MHFYRQPMFSQAAMEHEAIYQNVFGYLDKPWLLPACNRPLLQGLQHKFAKMLASVILKEIYKKIISHLLPGGNRQRFTAYPDESSGSISSLSNNSHAESSGSNSSFSDGISDGSSWSSSESFHARLDIEMYLRRRRR